MLNQGLEKNESQKSKLPLGEAMDVAENAVKGKSVSERKMLGQNLADHDKNLNLGLDEADVMNQAEEQLRNALFFYRGNTPDRLLKVEGKTASSWALLADHARLYDDAYRAKVLRKQAVLDSLQSGGVPLTDFEKDPFPAYEKTRVPLEKLFEENSVNPKAEKAVFEAMDKLQKLRAARLIDLDQKILEKQNKSNNS